MNIPLKNPSQVAAMIEGGKKLSAILRQLVEFSKAGTTLLKIEDLACKLIKKTGGEAGFKKVPGYHWATCLNINDGVVHGVPNKYILKNDDVVSIDIGLYYRGLHTDMCHTFQIKDQRSKIKNKKEKDKTERFLKAGRETLKLAIAKVRPGNYIGHISWQIQTAIEKKGYNCIRALTGHGVGEKLHEPPAIPCVLKEEIYKTPKILSNMALAIEIIYTQGKVDLVVDNDGWTIRTTDGKIAAVFEATVLTTDSGVRIITPLLF